jgi:hypothetical protein
MRKNKIDKKVPKNIKAESLLLFLAHPLAILLCDPLPILLCSPRLLAMTIFTTIMTLPYTKDAKVMKVIAVMRTWVWVISWQGCGQLGEIHG